jgi:hypothetical protein
MKRYGSFAEAIKATKFEIYANSSVVAPATWQSIDVKKRPEMVTHEVQWWGFKVEIPRYLTADDRFGVQITEDIKPNLPWADDHFEERVCGLPLNPGTQWSKWPYASSANTFRKEGMFNHTYAERYWPKYATVFGEQSTIRGVKEAHDDIEHNLAPHVGIRYDYGDLGDVVKQLVKDPASRQAVLPVFFPEDTGAVHGDRVPCSIFYQFMVRDGRLDLFYYLRSCDFVRHYRDDIYLTLRLQLWMIDRLRENGIDVSPGMFLMQIGSLHIFRNDWQVLFNEPFKGTYDGETNEGTDRTAA